MRPMSQLRSVTHLCNQSLESPGPRRWTLIILDNKRLRFWLRSRLCFHEPPISRSVDNGLATVSTFAPAMLNYGLVAAWQGYSFAALWLILLIRAGFVGYRERGHAQG